MKSNKGISLIVLVITIIVMIILAGAVVLTLNNSGIIDKAEHAVDITNKSSVKTYLEMIWAEEYSALYLDGKLTEENLIKNVEQRIENDKIDVSAYNIKISISGVEFIDEEAKFNHGGIIPKGGKYITNASIIENEDNGCNIYDYSAATTYTEGDEFPELKNGDKYVYGDFTYVYNGDTGINVAPDLGIYGVYTEADGWYVSYTSTNPNAGIILEKINNANVTCMVYTFFGNYKIETLTNIPSTIKYMEWAFGGATKLKSIPELPEDVEDMDEAFSGCTSLVGTITINAEPNSCDGCFTEVDMSKITLAGKASRETKLAMAETGLNADKVTIVD